MKLHKLNLVNIAVIALLILPSQINAAPLQFTFDMRVDSVNTGTVVINDIFAGEFFIDDSNFSGIGIEDFSPTSPPSTGELLSFDVDILSSSFSSGDDFGFPSFPRVIFENGSVTQMEFESTTLDPQLTIFLTASGIEFAYAQGPFGAEIQQFSGFVENVSAVPVPAAVWLFGSGLMGVIGVARRRKI